LERGLDLTNPFVSLVFDYQRGQATYADCVSLLEELERKHDVVLVAPGLPYVVREERLMVSEESPFAHLQDPDDAVLDALIRENLFPFLSDTHALLWSAFPDDSDMVFRGRYFYHGTARAYAAAYAEWAKSVRWFGTSRWSYVHFYYAQSLSEEMYRWLQILHAVVSRRCGALVVTRS
jgi:hypothetical protein